jgi:hypothetical protein
MSLGDIKKSAEEGPDSLYFTLHADDLIQNLNLSAWDIIDIILKGKKAKEEPDEETNGEYTKFTIDWKDFRIVVKDTDPPKVITVRLKNQ